MSFCTEFAKLGSPVAMHAKQVMRAAALARVQVQAGSLPHCKCD